MLKYKKIFLLIQLLLLIPIKANDKKIISFFKAKNSGVITSEFFQLLKDLFNPEVFVETGTFYGHTSLKAADYFNEVHTVELDMRLYRNAIKTFENKSNIFVYNGDSKVILNNVLPNLKNKKLLFFLDAHWSGDGTAKSDENTPIISELAVIKNHGISDATILIDDMRFFQSNYIIEQQLKSDPEDTSMLGYQSLDNLKIKLLEINPEYNFIIFGDIGIAYINNADIKVSPFIEAMTISKFFNDDASKLSNLEYEKVLEAEKIIASCNPTEKEAIQDLINLKYPKLLFWHYKLWYALTLFGSNEKDKAIDQLKEIISLGLNYYRIKNYLSN